MFGSSLAIGNDILDIGSSKFDHRNDERAIGSGAMMPPSLTLGDPGQFEVPNVADVSLQWFTSIYSWYSASIIYLNALIILCISYPRYLTSLSTSLRTIHVSPPTSAETISPLPVATAIKANRSNSPREPPPSLSNLMGELLYLSTPGLQWAHTSLQELSKRWLKSTLSSLELWLAVPPTVPFGNVI